MCIYEVKDQESDHFSTISERTIGKGDQINFVHICNTPIKISYFAFLNVSFENLIVASGENKKFIY